jgi:hypothetical protein
LKNLFYRKSGFKDNSYKVKEILVKKNSIGNFSMPLLAYLPSSPKSHPTG